MGTKNNIESRTKKLVTYFKNEFKFKSLIFIKKRW